MNVSPAGTSPQFNPIDVNAVNHDQATRSVNSQLTAGEVKGDSNATARLSTASGPQLLDRRGYDGLVKAGPPVMPTVKNFNADAYLARNPDVAATTPRDFALNHYLAFGRAEGRAA